MAINFYKIINNFFDRRKEFALIEAAKWGDKNKLQELLAQGVNPNITNKNGQTPLALLVRSQRHAEGELLLAHGADPNCSAVGDMYSTYTSLVQSAE